MTVIAKMNVATDPRAFGDSQLVELSCVCDNRLMTIHTPDCENYTFNQASPQGDARINLTSDIEFRNQEELYLIFKRSDEPVAFEKAIAVVRGQCVSITDYGGTSRRIEVASQYRHYSEPVEHPKQVGQFNLRMMIDNPAASVQFEPGKAGYWIGLYRASEMTMQEALAAAE